MRLPGPTPPKERDLMGATGGVQRAGCPPRTMHGPATARPQEGFEAGQVRASGIRPPSAGLCHWNKEKAGQCSVVAAATLDIQALPAQTADRPRHVELLVALARAIWLEVEELQRKCRRSPRASTHIPPKRISPADVKVNPWVLLDCRGAAGPKLIPPEVAGDRASRAPNPRSSSPAAAAFDDV